MTLLELFAGLLVLLAGGDSLVRGASRLARSLGVSPLFIGLVLVGFGTSTPELVTSVQAALIGSPGIAIGNIVGSNLANILLILGLTAIIAPVPAPRASLLRDGVLVVATAILMALLAGVGTFGRVTGLVLLAVLAAYLAYAWRMERSDGAEARADIPHPEEKPSPASLAKNIALTLGGLIGVMLGGRFLVNAAVDIAETIGVSQAVIGLTVVAIGTSLPELVASMIAAFKRQTDIALGNILGSNIYNILGIGGITAVVSPVEVPGEMISFDIPVMVLASLALILFAWTGGRLARREGVALFGGYLAYMALLWP
jgi:cation:H+ antiporter